ncbi:hypothetical protein EV179_004752 [Coemansia sp. RSA 487]|nr:hypothetical protein LPJ74_005617 [Coemansia sp. RSA 1843]KAJ2088813.1 hypothetical protein IW138_003885 [Coemansia sp. RSA 986]KAJ2212357.1 hypothetical protein EV179_004752 [Coemansia sp. RSA 487]
MGRGRCPEFRNLSSSSRAARINEQPWRKRFREQCLDRLNKAREQSFMLHRNLSQLSQESDASQPGKRLSDGSSYESNEEMDDQEMYSIIQQEWALFKEEMERQSIEYGALDDSIIDDIESDLERSSACYEKEYAEWEEYENKILEEDMVDAEMMELCMDMDNDLDMNTDAGADVAYAEAADRHM